MAGSYNIPNVSLHNSTESPQNLQTKTVEVTNTVQSTPNANEICEKNAPININIYNPSVNPAANAVTNAANCYGQYAYPGNYYLPHQNSSSPNDSQAIAKAYLSTSSIAEEKIKKKETHKKEIVELTDDYIQSLENYLNNDNKQIRIMGIKELNARFKEQKTRANDIALTNLLNKALQDPAKEVRFIALATLSGGDAKGDKLTQEILQNMQRSSNVFGEDALLAANILLKMVGNTVEIEEDGPDPKKTKAKE